MIYSIILAHWQKILWVGAVLAILFGVYAKGRYDCRTSYRKALDQEIAKRIAEYEKERNKNQEKKDQILEHRRKNPVNDKRDSCILSNNPLSVNCLE